MEGTITIKLSDFDDLRDQVENSKRKYNQAISEFDKFSERLMTDLNQNAGSKELYDYLQLEERLTHLADSIRQIR